MDTFSPPSELKTAVLFLIFNRLDTTKEVFEKIRSAKPPRLYIASDGPREGRESESELVNEIRSYVCSRIDWDCEVKTLFRDRNLGCKYAVSEAINWFFSHEEKGIVLEDDCLPSLSFFWYCEELLEKYQLSNDVYVISGDSRGAESVGMKEDYGFCKYPLIWGWASWARVWTEYDAEIKDWPHQKDRLPSTISTNKCTIRFWKGIFEKMYKKEIDTWDYQLSYLLLKNKAKCIVPRVNLIKNIGFGPDATHTLEFDSQVANRENFEITLPLKNKSSDSVDKEIDAFYDEFQFNEKGIFHKLLLRLNRLSGR